MGNFTFNETKIKGVYIIDVKTYGDERGYFMETYKESDFAAAGLDYKFVQDNQSSSKKGVLRGLHFQKTHPQAKLVREVGGSTSFRRKSQAIYDTARLCARIFSRFGLRRICL